MEVKLVKFTVSFLQLSWEWFNDEELRYLTNTPVFTRDDQILWFNKISSMQNYRIWGIRADHVPVGACGIRNIENNEGEYWGYIGIKELRGKGIGSQVMILVEKEALKLKLKKLWLKVLPDNSAAITLYKKSGYTTADMKDNLLVMSKGLLKVK